MHPECLNFERQSRQLEQKLETFVCLKQETSSRFSLNQIKIFFGNDTIFKLQKNSLGFCNQFSQALPRAKTSCNKDQACPDSFSEG